MEEIREPGTLQIYVVMNFIIPQLFIFEN